MPSAPVLLALAALLSAAIGWTVARGMRTHRAGDGLPRIVVLLARIPLPPPVRAVAGGRVVADGLIAAGLPVEATAPVVIRARAGGAVMGAVFGAACALLIAPLLIALTPVWVLIGRIGPDRAIARRARARRAAIVEALPDLLDLMVICVEAGMALDPALSLAADRLGGALGEEVRATLSDQALGTPRREAYRGLAARTASEDVGRLVASLLQAEELGTPLALALAGQAEALRSARRQRARDRAARAAPRIQLVVALVMVPGAMLLVLGVMVVEMAAQVGIAIGGP